MESYTRLTYRIIHHLCRNSSKNWIMLALKLYAYRLYVEEVVTRILIGREGAFGPLQCFVSPGSNETLRVKRVSGG